MYSLGFVAFSCFLQVPQHNQCEHCSHQQYRYYQVTPLAGSSLLYDDTQNYDKEVTMTIGIAPPLANPTK